MHELRRSPERCDVVALRISKSDQMLVDIQWERGGAAEDAQPAAVRRADHGVAIVGVEGQDPIVASAEAEAKIELSVMPAVAVQDPDPLKLRAVRFALMPALDDGQ